MHLKHLTPLAALAGLASSQTLLDLISGNSELSTLGSLLNQTGLLTALASATNITVLAPTNAAFNTFTGDPAVQAAIAADPGLVTAVLQYHVLSGVYHSSVLSATPAFPKSLLTNTSFTNVTGGQVVKAQALNNSVIFTSGLLKQSTVTTANAHFNGGIAHVIDTVLTVPVSDSQTAVAANLTALAGALQQANLVTTVDNLKDVTIFAPTNAAFGAIASTVSALTTAQLATVLQYHVVQGTVGYSSALTSGQTIPTVDGGATVRVTINGANIRINSANVAVADVLVSNGVAHVIDSVLSPPNSTTSGSGSGGGSGGGSGSGSGSPSASGSGGGAASASGAAGNPPQQAAAPIQTAAVGAAALFGGAVFLANM